MLLAIFFYFLFHNTVTQHANDTQTLNSRFSLVLTMYLSSLSLIVFKINPRQHHKLGLMDNHIFDSDKC